MSLTTYLLLNVTISPRASSVFKTEAFGRWAVTTQTKTYQEQRWPLTYTDDLFPFCPSDLQTLAQQILTRPGHRSYGHFDSQMRGEMFIRYTDLSVDGKDCPQSTTQTSGWWSITRKLKCETWSLARSCFLFKTQLWEECSLLRTYCFSSLVPATFRHSSLSLRHYL